MPNSSCTLGRLKIHLVPICASSAQKLIKFNFSVHSRSSYCNRTTLVPLSDQTMLDVPPTKQEVVSTDSTISTWTAQIVRQKKDNSPPLLGIPTKMSRRDLKWAEVFNPSETRRLLCKSLFGKFSHNYLSGCGAETYAQNRDRINESYEA